MVFLDVGPVPRLHTRRRTCSRSTCHRPPPVRLHTVLAPRTLSTRSRPSLGQVRRRLQAVRLPQLQSRRLVVHATAEMSQNRVATESATESSEKGTGTVTGTVTQIDILGIIDDNRTSPTGASVFFFFARRKISENCQRSRK